MIFHVITKWGRYQIPCDLYHSFVVHIFVVLWGKWYWEIHKDTGAEPQSGTALVGTGMSAKNPVQGKAFGTKDIAQHCAHGKCCGQGPDKMGNLYFCTVKIMMSGRV